MLYYKAIYNSKYILGGIDIELTALLQKTSQLEQKWIIRMLLKNITIGIGHNKILNLWHPDGVELFDVCNNLLKVWIKIFCLPLNC